MASEAAKQTKLRLAFNAHYEAISRYCHRRLPAADANDATAQVFAVAWRRIDDMPSDEGTLPWLYTVARHQVSSTRRSARRLSNLRIKLYLQADRLEPGPEALVVRNAEQEQLLEAMAKLRAQDREILLLRAYEHLTIAEIATVLDCSVEAAKKRAARALTRLRRASGISDSQGAVASSRALSEGGDA